MVTNHKNVVSNHNLSQVRNKLKLLIFLYNSKYLSYKDKNLPKASHIQKYHLNSKMGKGDCLSSKVSVGH